MEMSVWLTVTDSGELVVDKLSVSLTVTVKA